jgi:hypothetical protein
MQVTCVWQSEKHSAFTDLINFEGRWWCVFREGLTHMSLDGGIRIMTSVEGHHWQTQTVLTWQGGDLRDPKLSVRADGALLLTTGMRWSTPVNAREAIYSLGFLFNVDTQCWQEPVIDAMGKATWRWAPTWHAQRAYSVGYAGRDRQGCLYQSDDGFHWCLHVAPFFPLSPVFTNESSLAFDTHNTAYCLTRRDAAQGAVALLGTARPPYLDWHWRKTNVALGGPKLLCLSNGEWIAAFRKINYRRGTARTLIQKLDVKTARFRPWLTLPSGGDTSYAGLVEYQGRLLVSYYSSHKNHQASIFIADIPLRYKKRSRRFQ